MPKKYNYTKKTGRPRKYQKSELPQLGLEMEKYFSSFLKKLNTKKDVPFLEAWGREVGISDDTIINYTKDSKEFLAAYKNCKQIQKEILIKGGLKGYFNPTSFIFTAKNITDMRDKTEVAHSGELEIDVKVTKMIDKVYGKSS